MPPGRHRVYSKAENWAEIDVSVAEGQVVFVQQETAIGIVMARNTLSTLPEPEGKYYMKTLSLGTILKGAAPGAGTGAATPGAGAPAAPVQLDDLKDLLPK